MSNKVTYRQQFTRCGKERCRACREGAGHGPYWYAYWSEKGRTVSKYIGVHLPPHLQAAQDSQQKAEPDNAGTNATDDVHNNTAPILRVYLLGQFRVERRSSAISNEWRPIDNRTWQRRRARTLLACLLNSTGRRLGREQVMEQLWPDLDSAVAANRLNGAVHELRQILEPELDRPAASHLLQLKRDILELGDSSYIWVDAETFESLLKEAHATHDPLRAEALFEEAAILYGGSYLLEELYSEWTIQRRDALQRSWIGLLLKLAHVRAERGAYVGAIEALDRLRTSDPTNETALQRLMILLTQLDRRGEALQAYQQHKSMLQRDYEGEPLPETRTLYESLRKGNLPTLYLPKAQMPVVREKEEVPLTVSIPSSPPLSTPTLNILSLNLSRPTFQLSRHNQSPLVGRQRECATMYQVLHSIEELALPLTPTNAEAVAEEQQLYRETTAETSLKDLKRPHLLLLQGEPGIGKTRLAEELSLEAYTRGWAVVWSRAYEQEGAMPYRLWTELLRALLQGISPHNDNGSDTTLTALTALLPSSQIKLERLSLLLPDLAQHFSRQHLSSTLHSSAPPYSHEQERLYLWEATLELFTAVSNTHPLLLVLDDLHWADESSIELLTYLTHHLRQQPVLLVATCRDEELPQQHKLRTLVADLRREQAIITLPIQPLTHSQIGVLVAHLPKNVIHSIQTQASGNPFFAEELARYVGTHEHDTIQSISQTQERKTETLTHPLLPTHHAQEDTRHTNRHQRTLPEAIAAVLERRLGRLSTACQNLLGKAAVLGGSFELGQLLSMAQEHTEDTTLDLLEEALFAGILTEEGTGMHITYHFWHPLIVSHLYERMSAARRAQLHRRAAEAIKHAHTTGTTTQAEKEAAALVYHLNKGGSDLASIAYYAELAGNNASMLAAYAEARQYYLQAYQALNGSLLYAQDTTTIHDTMQHITQEKFIHSSSDPLHRCRLLEHIAECFVVQGNFEEARHLYQYILALRSSETFQRHGSLNETAQKPQEVQIQALLWREIGNTWTATGDYEQAYESYRCAKEIMRQADITTGAAWACLHLQYGAMLRLDGNYQEARRYLQEALAILEREPPFHKHVQGQTRTERALVGGILEIGYAHEQLGIVDAMTGQMSDGLKHMHIARDIYEQHELFTDTARICGNLGAVYLIRGELTAARTHLHHSYDLAERIGDLPNMTFVTCNLGDIANRSGNLLESENWFKRGLVLAEQIHDREHMSWSSVELAAVQQDLGHLQEAAENIRRAIAIGRAIKSTRCIRYALVGLGDLRVIQAIIACELPLYRDEQNTVNTTSHMSSCHRLLRRAKSTLRRAIALDGLDVEATFNGKLLLATVYFLEEDLEIARCMAIQTMSEAQEHEITRVVGRTQRLLGRILAAQGRYVESEHYFEQALHIFSTCELRLDYARTLHGYGTTLVQPRISLDNTTPHVVQQREQQLQRGVGYLREAHDIFATCQATIDLAWVDHILTTLEQHIVVQ